MTGGINSPMNRECSIEFVRRHEIRAILETVTGLHIGAGRDTVEIGGVDSPIIRHPHTQQPYIPGSSLKGKLRSLLEWALHKVQPDGKPYGTGCKNPPSDDIILRTFGVTAENWAGGPTRIVVRDAHLVKEWVQEKMKAGLPLTEDKTEVVIDRIQGKAHNIGPRTVERVPAGARFELEILFREFSVDNDGGRQDRVCLNRLIEALKLLEQDCLGGSGSRGYGKVRITDLRINEEDRQAQFDAMKPFQLEAPNEIVPIGS